MLSAGALGLTGLDVTRVLALHDDLIAQGATAFVVTTESSEGLSSARCEQLNTAAGVQVAGARGELAGSPQNGRALRSVTRGYLHAAVPDAAAGARVVAGARAASVHHLVTGSLVADAAGSPLTVDAVAAPSRRDARVDGEILVVSPPIFRTWACLVIAEPAATHGVDNLLTTWFSGGDARAAPLIIPADVSQTPQAQLRDRPAQLVPVVASGITAVMLLVAWLVRRADFALYRLLGARPGALVGGLGLEALLLVALPQVAAMAFAFCAFPRLHSGAGLETALLTAGQVLSTGLIAVPLGIILLFSKNPLTLVREGT